MATIPESTYLDRNCNGKVNHLNGNRAIGSLAEYKMAAECPCYESFFTRIKVHESSKLEIDMF